MLKALSTLLLSAALTLVLLVGGSPLLAAEPASNRDEVIFILEKAIASQYYDYQKRRVIRVFVNDFTSTLQDNGLLRDYFHSGVVASLEQANQFVLGDFDTVGADCLLSLSLQSLGKQFIKIDGEVMDARSGQVVASVSKTYPSDSFAEPALQAFRQEHAQRMLTASQIGSTRLVVYVNSSGKSADEYAVVTSTYSSASNTTGQYGATYEDTQNYAATDSGDYSRQSNTVANLELKQKIGRTSIYPTDIKVFINNRPYKPNSQGIAFDQLVEPGPYEVNVQFRKAIWDGVRNNEVKGRSFSRTFRLDMAKDASLRFDLGIKLHGDEAEISGVTRRME